MAFVQRVSHHLAPVQSIATRTSVTMVALKDLELLRRGRTGVLLLAMYVVYVCRHHTHHVYVLDTCEIYTVDVKGSASMYIANVMPKKAGRVFKKNIANNS